MTFIKHSSCSISLHIHGFPRQTLDLQSEDSTDVESPTAWSLEDPEVITLERKSKQWEATFLQ